MEASGTARKERYIRIQNKVQPYIKGAYARVCEVLPDSLVMSDRYFEAKRYLEMAEGCDERSPAVLEIQRKLLARTLRNAVENVPFYQERVRLDPEAITPESALESLAHFPFIDKEVIMADPSRFVSTKFSRYSLIYTTSGGSTGRGIALYKSVDEYQSEQAFVENMWSKYGYERSSRILRIGADAIVGTEEHPCHVKHRRLMVSPRHLNERWLPEIVREIDRYRPEFIHAYPSCVEVLAGYLKVKGRNLKVKAIFLASEEVTPQQMDLFQEVFDSPICFFYGASEHVLWAYGCYDGKNMRYHFNPLYGYAENLQDEYGHELVGTALWNDAMPLIRYRTQDYGRIEDGIAECPHCHRSMRSSGRLDGRRQTYLITKDGTKFPGPNVWVDKFVWDYVSTFQYVQNQPGAIELHICPRENFTPEIEARILEAQRQKLSEWFDPITIVKVPELCLTSAGKRRMIVVNI